MPGYHGPLGSLDHEVRVEVIRENLRIARGSVKRASELIGVTRSVLWYHLRRYKLVDEPRRFRAVERRDRFAMP